MIFSAKEFIAKHQIEISMGGPWTHYPPSYAYDDVPMKQFATAP